VTGSGVNVTGSGVNGFLGKYYINGTNSWIRQFGDSHTFVSPSGISTDAGGIFVAGTGGQYDLFLSKYDSSGNMVWSTGFDAPDYSHVSGTEMSADTSGIYLTVISGHGTSLLAKYDKNGNNVWSIRMKPVPPGLKDSTPISVGDNGIYVSGGIVVGSNNFDADISAFSQSSSLVFFGLNPPFSFGLVGLLAGAVFLSLMFFRRQRKKRPRPQSTNYMRYGQKLAP
jgi:hypothetical protein